MFHALNVGFTFEAMLIAADALQARRQSTDGTALADAIRADQHHRAHDARRPDQVRRQGPEHRHRVGLHPEPQPQPTVVLPRERRELAPVFPVPDWNART